MFMFLILTNKAILCLFFPINQAILVKNDKEIIEMAKIISAHDKFFRSAMQNQPVAMEFFQHYLPSPLCEGLSLDTIKLQNSTYIDKDFQETVSDLVFNCRYKEGDKSNSEEEARVVLLVEHQSTPDQLMPFRVYHYMFNFLHGQLKERAQKHAKDKLNAVYALVFYHGKQTPYPYSMNLADSFYDPLNIMNGMFPVPVNLIDANQITEEELKQQNLFGLMASALKHSRDSDVGRRIIEDMKSLAQIQQLMDLSPELTLNLSTTYLNYMLIVGNIVNLKQFVQGIAQLPEPIRGETMTAAEQLRAQGREEGLEEGMEKGMEKGIEKGMEKGIEKGIEKGMEKGMERGIEKGTVKVAINSLKEGIEPRFIARITGLDLAVILKLKAQLE